MSKGLLDGLHFKNKTNMVIHLQLLLFAITLFVCNGCFAQNASYAEVLKQKMSTEIDVIRGVNDPDISEKAIQLKELAIKDMLLEEYLDNSINDILRQSDSMPNFELACFFYNNEFATYSFLIVEKSNEIWELYEYERSSKKFAYTGNMIRNEIAEIIHDLSDLHCFLDDNVFVYANFDRGNLQDFEFAKSFSVHSHYQILSRYISTLVVD